MSFRTANVKEVAAEWVVRINDPDATEADFGEWQTWLSQSLAHREAYQALEHAWVRASQVNSAPWPTEAELRVDRQPKVRWALAAGVAVALVGGMTAWLASRPPANLIQTATAEQRSVRLNDGSRVELGGESRLRVDLTDKVRALRLEEGEAYFEVARDRARPFVVRVGETQVRALGTAFNIEKSMDRALITVTQGLVRISTTNDSLDLGTGEQARIDRGGAHKLTADPRAVTAWRDGRLEYLHEELRYVLDDVNRYVDRKVVVDPQLAHLEFTGTVFLDHLDEWLTTLQGSFPVTLVEHGERRELARASK